MATRTERPPISSSPSPDQQDVDQRNEEFWNELCGTWLAQRHGLVGRDRETLDAFDRAYFEFYPYLLGYLDRFEIAGRRVLEIGLGYGTLGQEIVRRGAEYYGLDIAVGPIQMMRHRLSMLGMGGEHRIVQGTAAAIPFPDETFDYVYTIGCLHHTGALAESVEEVRRVLAPSGTAVVMLYHADSARQIRHVKLPAALARWPGRTGPSREDFVRRYDRHSSGAAAPHTDFVSRRDVRHLFRHYSDVRIDTRNFDDQAINGRILIPRKLILGSPLERFFGLDLYIVARR